MTHIFVGAFTEESLMNDATHAIIPQIINDGKGQRKMVVLDGAFIEGVQDRLLDGILSKDRILCLSSTEQLVVSQNVYLVFEMSTISSISPHHIAQCRLVHLGEQHVTWTCLIESWLKSVLPANLEFPDQLVTFLLSASLEYNASLDHHQTGYHAIKVVNQMLSLVAELIQPTIDAVNKKHGTIDNEVRQYFQCAVIFAMVILSADFSR